MAIFVRLKRAADFPIYLEDCLPTEDVAVKLAGLLEVVRRNLKMYYFVHVLCMLIILLNHYTLSVPTKDEMFDKLSNLMHNTQNIKTNLKENP